MSAELPTPLQLVDAPELAVVHVLEVALAAVEHSLLAAYPELQDGLCAERPTRLSSEACLADGVLVHVTALETALFRYRLQLSARGLLSPPGF